MLRRIVRHEWHVLRSETTTWFTVSLLAICIGYAVLNGVQWVALQERTLWTAESEQSARYDGLKRQVIAIESGVEPAPFADPRLPDMAGGRLAWTYAAMPPLALAALSVGQSDVLPYYFRVSTAARASVLGSSELENPHRLLNGRFDLSFVVIYLFPLLIIAQTYNLISLEKEEGTLALLLSQPVALSTFIAGKVGLRASFVALSLMLLSVSAMLVGGVEFRSGGDLIRLACWIGIVAAYGAFWFGLVLFVTSFGKGSSANALSLASLWLVLIVILPSMLNLAVGVLYPMPSRVEMIEALRIATDRVSARGEQLLARYYGDHPELVGDSNLGEIQKDVAITRLAIDDEIARQVEPVVARYETQLARQQALVDRFRLLSPAILGQEAFNDVAGTGTVRYRQFVSRVEEYHSRWRSFFASMTVRKGRMTPVMYDQLPQFGRHDDPIAPMLTRTSLVLAILFAAGGLLSVVGIRRIRDYPVAG